MIIRSSSLYVPTTEVTSEEIARYKWDNTFTSKSGESVTAWEFDGRVLRLPRAYRIARAVENRFCNARRIRDIAYIKDPAKKKKPFQIFAIFNVIAGLRKRFGGILVCRTGGGKTVMGLDIIAKLKVRTLILVDQIDLVAQWAARIQEFLCGDFSVGFYYGEDRNWKNKDIVIATVQSLLENIPEGFVTNFGLVVYDEVHVFSAPLFLKAGTRFEAQYRLGLTATPYRGDGLEGLFFAHIGPVLHEVPKKDVDALGVTIDPDVYVVPTKYKAVSEKEAGSQKVDIVPMIWKWNPYLRRKEYVVNYSKLLNMCCLSDAHNLPIFEEIKTAVAKDRKILFISDRNEQLRILHKWCQRENISSALLTGKVKGVKKRIQALTAQVILSNFTLTQKGLDCPQLDVLMFGSLRKVRASVEQAAGRVSRNYIGKKKPLIIVFEPECSVMRLQVDAILTILYKLGCRIVEPGVGRRNDVRWRKRRRSVS